MKTSVSEAEAPDADASGGDAPGGAAGRPWPQWVARVPPEAIIAALVVVVAIALTRDGLLLHDDSALYIKSSRLFRSDPSRIFNPPVGTDLSIRGLMPPLYPTLLAAAGSLEAARWVMVVAAGVTAFALVRAVRGAATVSAAVAVALLVFANRGTLLLLFGFVMSDGIHLMITACVAAVLLGAVRASEPDRFVRSVLGASVLASLAFCTRYAGLGIVVGVATAVALLGSASIGRRIRWSVASLAIGVAPMAVWTAILSRTGDVGHREPGLYPIRGAFGALFDTFGWFYLPRRVIELIGEHRVATLTAVGIAATFVWSVHRIWLAARRRAGDPSAAAAVFLLLGWGCFCTMVATHVVFDQQVTVSGRFAMPWIPMQIAAFGIVAAAPRHADRATPSGPRRRWPAAVTACVVVLATPGLVRAVAEPSEVWWHVEHLPPPTLVAALEREGVPHDRLVYTNREGIVYLETGRPTARMPRHRDLYSFRPNRHYDRRLREIAREVDAGRAVLLVWEEDLWGASVADIRRRTNLVVTYRDAEGALFVGASRR